MTELGELQRRMEQAYGERDRARGMPATVAWLAEEVGELAKAASSRLKASREWPRSFSATSSITFARSGAKKAG